MLCQLLPICCLFVACGGSDKKDKAESNFMYAPPTQTQLQMVIDDWNSRDLKPRDVTLALTDNTNPLYQVRIYQHSVGNNVHYGLITVPTATGEDDYPVVLFADGLISEIRSSI